MCEILWLESLIAEIFCFVQMHAIRVGWSVQAF